MALVSKCSATRHSVAAPIQGAQQPEGFGGPIHLRHAPFWGGVAATPFDTQWKQQNEPRQGCSSYTLERDTGGGCSACAT